eukprot:gene7422-555_t
MVVHVTEDGAFSCCASKAFALKLAQCGPYPDFAAMIDVAKRIWWQDIGIVEWMSAFAAHPKIGDSKGMEAKPKGFREFSRSEQAAAVASTSEDVQHELRELNQLYYDKFGIIFIIFAKGKSSPEILDHLRTRYHRTPYEELQQAAAEQMRITELRLGAMLGISADLESAKVSQMRVDKVLQQITAAQTGAPLRSPITTHVLDQAMGCPASGLPIKLTRKDPHSMLYESVGGGVTNGDGRIGNLMAPSAYVAPGKYRMWFDTSAYLKACKITEAGATEHYHVPLLLSPYGYSTYRGS